MNESNQRLSVLEKIGYSLGDLAANLIFQTLMTFLAFFYTDVYQIPAATAAYMAAPRAGACSDLATFIGISRISANVCMMKGDFLATPPIPTTVLISTPSDSNRSIIFLDPKHMASTRDLNICGALVPRFNWLIAAFNP